MADEATPTAAPATPAASAAPAYDTAPVHDFLNKAEEAFTSLFKGHVPDEHQRFRSFLSTVRMIVDQSADRSAKGD